MTLFGLGAGWDLFLVNIICYVVFVVVRRHVDVWLPDRFFDPRRRRFRSAAWERDGEFYRDILKIDRWKDDLPCLTPLTGFSKKTILGLRSEYLERFVMETCRAESNHVSAIVFVMLMRAWTPSGLWWLCFVIAVFGNVPFICIQRYNRPRLLRTLEGIGARHPDQRGEIAATA
ncbi:MAG: hypothetical protein LBV06_10870 [Propionibacteriaceae bacterium]|jgi:glycosyl-4,4'-diaponeurosporenoate acyltransferase|nr:hypothetical protein [Propionibacteriaceae bacterium]